MLLTDLVDKVKEDFVVLLPLLADLLGDPGDHLLDSGHAHLATAVPAAPRRTCNSGH